jgi:hypothetical protein
MRYLWLWMLFALPVSARELQVDISGRAFDSQAQSFGTFAVSFDVDTLSGIQIYNVDSPLVSYAAISLAITNLTADVNGVNIFSVPATLATLTKGASPFTQLLTQGPDGVQWDLEVTQSLTITNRDDPLLALLTKSFAPFYADSQIAIGVNGDPKTFLGDEVHVKFTPLGVPEPGILALLLLGLVSVAVHNARLRRPQAAG